MSLDKDRHTKKYKAFIIRLDKEQSRRIKRFAKMEKRTVTDIFREWVQLHAVDFAND